MGCDIHMYAEKKVKGVWEKVNIKNPQCDGAYNDYVFFGRNYGFFSILAGVRNYANAYIEPIDQPRGLPDDVSPEIKKISDDWGVDGHSHSWFMLRELKDFPWKDKKAPMQGVVTLEDFKSFIIDGKEFTTWARWASGLVVPHEIGLKIINENPIGYFFNKLDMKIIFFGFKNQEPTT